MEEFRRLDSVSFERFGTWHISKLFDIKGKFGGVEYFIGESDNGILQHKRDEDILLSELRLEIIRNKDVFSRSELQEIFKNVKMK